jgi:hypothetical protein
VKITNADYGTLHMAITRVRAAKLIPERNYYVLQNLTAKRWRWDLLWRAKREGYLPDRFIEDTIYSYANDDHIDTALRRITL